MTLPSSINEVAAEFSAFEDLSDDPRADRTQLLIRLGRALEPMPDALKTDVNQVPGCASTVWVYPVPTSESTSLRFYADSNSGVTKGIIALILMVVQGKSAREVLTTNVEEELAPLGLQKHFSSLRTSGLKNMILKIYETAERLASA